MNRQDLKQILSSKFEFEKWKELLGLMFPKVDFLTKAISVDTGLAKAGGQVGTIRLDDGRSLGLFLFEVADNIIVARNRKGLRDIAIRYVDQDIIHGALVLYYSDNQPDYRLTFVSKQTVINEDGVIETKTTAPKRYTFLLGSNEPCATAANRLFELVDKKQKGSLFLTDVEEAFSVERLNKDFFNGYKDRYKKFLAYLDDDTKDNRDYVKKLLGRLVFLQFLQKKGWMGVPAINDKWGNGDRNYLYNLVKRHNGKDRLLSDVLETLFFKTLNEPRTDDIADPILGDNIKIPYLNGGLFDRDEIDKKDVDFPYAYFLELMEFFGMYNFTIDENDPDDAEVGVDPEMLGHIFENLLEDNKDKGAFYTPKEIVQYMSQESIAQYLKTHTDESLHLAIDELIKKRKVPEALQDKNAALKVYQLLADVKVCDPAIGSGAFPMGILNVLYHSRLLLYGFTNPTKEFSPSSVKRDIIQNNIYGVDIEKGAIDIARLRFWLSIVVDSDRPEALPNFDYKFMQGNSLLESYHGKDLSQILNSESKKTSSRKVLSNQYGMEFVTEETQKNLQIHLEQYFSINDHSKKEDVRKLINDSVKSYIRQTLFLKDDDIPLNTLDPSENQEFFLWHTWFKDIFDNGGFDIVIGNPPYIQLQADGGRLGNLYKNCGFETFARTGDIYSLFYEQGWNVLKHKGLLCFITSNKWMRAGYGENTRNFFAEKTNPLILIDLGANVFENATVDTNILLLSKSPNTFTTKCASFNRVGINSLENLSDFVQQQGTVCEFCGSDSWVILSPIEQSIKRKIESVGTPLKNWDINIYRGVLTGCNKAFIISTEKRNEILSNCKDDDERARTAELIRPILRGRDIKRYSYEWANLWLIATFPSRHYDIDKFPSVKAHLESYYDGHGNEVLEQTGAIHIINGEKVKSRKKTSNKWFETQDSISYWEDFSQPKIVYAELARTGNAFTIDTKCYMVSNTAYVMTIRNNDKKTLNYLLGFLNSRVMLYSLNQITSRFDETGWRWLRQFVEHLRIPHNNNMSLIAEIVSDTNKSNQKINSEKINKMVYSAYDLSTEEVEYINKKLYGF